MLLSLTVSCFNKVQIGFKHFSPVIMAIYRKKKFTSPKKVGGPEIGAAHTSQKVGGPRPAWPNRLRRQWLRTTSSDSRTGAQFSLVHVLWTNLYHKLKWLLKFAASHRQWRCTTDSHCRAVLMQQCNAKLRLLMTARLALVAFTHIDYTQKSHNQSDVTAIKLSHITPKIKHICSGNTRFRN